jgi:hypothetical protein
MKTLLLLLIGLSITVNGQAPQKNEQVEIDGLNAVKKDNLVTSNNLSQGTFVIGDPFVTYYTNLFTPPQKHNFKEFQKGGFADIQTTGIPISVLEFPQVVQVGAIFNKGVATVFPLLVEGNLGREGGGKGGSGGVAKPFEAHWDRKITSCECQKKELRASVLVEYNFPGPVDKNLARVHIMDDEAYVEGIIDDKHFKIDMDGKPTKISISDIPKIDCEDGFSFENLPMSVDVNEGDKTISKIAFVISAFGKWPLLITGKICAKCDDVPATFIKYDLAGTVLFQDQNNKQAHGPGSEKGNLGRLTGNENCTFTISNSWVLGFSISNFLGGHDIAAQGNFSFQAFFEKDER